MVSRGGGDLRRNLKTCLDALWVDWPALNKRSSPVPETVFGEEASGFEDVELQQDLQQVEGQKNPLRVGNHGVLLVQADEDGVDQDDEVVDDHERPERARHLQLLPTRNLVLVFRLAARWSHRCWTSRQSRRLGADRYRVGHQL